MKIGEIARLAGVSTSRIRFYEAEGLIAPADRDRNGYRDYPASLAELLIFVERAQRLGFSLNELRGAIATDHSAILPYAEMLGPLRRKVVEIDAHIAAAQALRGRLLETVGQIEACPTTEEELDVKALKARAGRPDSGPLPPRLNAIHGVHVLRRGLGHLSDPPSLSCGGAPVCTKGVGLEPPAEEDDD